jgi:Kelch motif
MKRSPLVLVASLFVAASATFAADEPANWVQVTDRAGWQPRDSQGEVVYNDRLWIFGGWFDSYHAPPRDVWSSPDGKTWTQVQKQAAWKHSDLAMTVVFKDKMWLMGGWYNGRLPGHSASDAVWSSVDGVTWDEVTPHAGWTPRVAAGAIVFKDKMWILGGTESYYFGDEKSPKNDVWSSDDGKVWHRATEHADWSPRGYHAAVVHDGKMWVLGGGNYLPKYRDSSDVWSSADGVHWSRATEAAPWHPRLWFSSVAYRDRIFVLGGWSNNPSQNWGDVWHSRDGKEWTELKSDRIWKARHEHSAYVFQDKIWVVGGHARPLSSEVWSLQLPKN